MARFTQFPLMITRSTIIYEIISPGCCRQQHIRLIRFLYVIRVAQTHTVWFERPFLLRLGTLLPDYTIFRETGFPKPDSEAGLPKPDSDPAPDSLGYLPIRLQIHGPIP